MSNKKQTAVEYRIYVKGILSFVKFTRKEFKRICSHMDTLGVNYTTEIINLIKKNNPDCKDKCYEHYEKCNITNLHK
jgi:hypothetical protein